MSGPDLDPRLGRLAYFEWSADPDSALDDEDAWAQANPALDVRLSREFIRLVERPAMSDEEFARERLGIFPDTDGEPVISPHDWSCGAVKFKPGDAAGWLLDPVAFGLDQTNDHEWLSIVAAGHCRSGGVGVDVVEHFYRPKRAAVIARMTELNERHGPKATVIDQRSKASAFEADLIDAGIDVTLTTTTDHQRAFAWIFQAILDHELHHLDQPELNGAVTGASTRPVGDGQLWNRRGDAVISPLVAATLACHGLLLPVVDSTPPEPKIRFIGGARER